MKIKEVTLFNGEHFKVPQGIQRLDDRSTHGWQVRYQGTRMFSDHSQDGSGAERALALAVAELLHRIATLPAPVNLQRSPSAGKTSDLPAGISGPIMRTHKRSSLRTAHLSVLLPQYGRPARCTSVYIASENTYTAARFEQALRKALQRRHQAEAAYEAAATRARRAAAGPMRAALKASAKVGRQPA